jgi:dihydropteroate synthase
MPNSRQWYERIFFRFNPEAISKEFNIPLSEVADFRAFLVTPNLSDQNSAGWASKGNLIYPLEPDQINDLISKLNYPAMRDFWKSTHSLRIHGDSNLIQFPSAMAIINMTPDSFYPVSRTKESELEQKLEEIKTTGCNIVDIGGQSTRPGSKQVSSKNEIRRISYAVETSLNMKFTVSIDSYRPEVLKECLEMGAHIINDVTGLENLEVGKLARKYDVPLIVMHKKGSFKTMQHSPTYKNVVNEIISFFLKKISQATALGIEDNLILDPGIGFGKRVEDNLKIIDNLMDFKLGHPLLIGLSRKSYIGEIMNESVDERGESSLIFNSVAIMKGADLIRVHDIKGNMKLIKIIKKLREV